MAVHFIDITRAKFLNEHKWVHRFTNMERFTEMMHNKKFTFVNPSKWSDPFEKFYLERDYIINSKKVSLPAKDNIFSVCMSGTLSSEAYWKVYAPKENGIRLTINVEKLLAEFLDLIPGCNIYIGNVSYKIKKEFKKISINKQKLITEIKNKIIGEQQIKLLLKKRKSFLY